MAFGSSEGFSVGRAHSRGLSSHLVVCWQEVVAGWGGPSNLSVLTGSLCAEQVPQSPSDCNRALAGPTALGTGSRPAPHQASSPLALSCAHPPHSRAHSSALASVL